MRSFSNIMTNFAGNLHLLVDSIVCFCACDDSIFAKKSLAVPNKSTTFAKVINVRQIAMATVTSVENTVTPALRRTINKARREYANGATISCSTPEEMQRYFDSL